MITYGFAKELRKNEDGTCDIKVRIPSIHGPYKQSDAKGRTIRNYVKDSDLPWYPSVILCKDPEEGDVLVIETIDSSNNNFIVLGITGGKYKES